jgi:hypothetical protein
MGMWDPVRREHVLAAAHEYDQLGQSRFLAKYKFGPARAYQLVIDGRSYDSKAILGAAHGYATGSALSSGEFSGGTSHNGAAWALRRLGFEVAQTADTGTLGSQPSAVVRGSMRRTIARSAPDQAADIVLVGCVKTKLPTAAPADELYTSPLFRKRRRYAEAAGRPWFILSALHGLVRPDLVLEPYDMYLAGQPVTYRRQWALRVVSDLIAAVGPLEGRTIELHAGASYVEPLEPLLAAAGADVRVPLRGLNQGQHLAWYSKNPASATVVPVGAPGPDLAAEIDRAIVALADAKPLSAVDFPWGRTDLQRPGLYAWWVDRPGAEDLGMSASGDRTLVYVGQAGATRWPSGTRSGATLFSRISSQYLGGRISSSTLRQTFAALLRDRLDLQLAAPGALTTDSERRLSRWMTDRLAATLWPTAHADHLRDIEHGVITRFDAPLNLVGAAPTDLRSRLSKGRHALHRPPE